MTDFFTIQPKELAALPPEKVVELFRQLLWAEAVISNIPLASLNVPSAIYVADGGVDAEIKGVGTTSKNGIIEPGLNRFQIKSGGFELNGPADYDDLLLLPASVRRLQAERADGKQPKPTKDDLNHRIKSCFEKNGRFIALLAGYDNPQKNDDKDISKQIAAYIEKTFEYKKPNIEVWRANTICGFLNLFPAFGLATKGAQNLPIKTFSEWSELGDMTLPLVQDQKQAQQITEITNKVRDRNSGQKHIRVIGEPGVGKTRTALEALRADDLQPLVLYTNRPNTLFDTGLVEYLIRTSKSSDFILVVDECSSEHREKLEQHFKTTRNEIKLITLYLEASRGDKDKSLLLVEGEGLSKANIAQIIQSYGIEPGRCEFWAEQCDGSPRVAHAIGINLRENPERPLDSTNAMNDVWSRYIAGDEDIKSEAARRSETILNCISAFKKFGWKGGVEHESQTIYKCIISIVDKNISYAEYQKTLERLVDRRILQGENTLYITPKLLHIKLWVDFWDRYGGIIDIPTVLKAIEKSDSMFDWFGQMFEYAHSSQAATKTIDSLLKPDGVFNEENLKQEVIARFFFHLSKASPSAASETLQRILQNKSSEWLAEELGESRRFIVWSLEYLAQFERHFETSATLLLNLARNETETWSNNSTGTFCDLFSLGYGELAPSELVPNKKLKILNNAIERDEITQKIALRAFSKALKIRHMSRISSAKNDLSIKIHRWSPKTYGDWFEQIYQYWQVLLRSDNKIFSQNLSLYFETVAESFGEVYAVKSLQEKFLTDVEKFLSKFPQAKPKFIRTIQFIINEGKDEQENTNKAQAQRLLSLLYEDSFSGKLQRYLATSIHDYFYEDMDHYGPKNPDFRRLAEYALKHEKELLANIPLLTSHEAHNVRLLGMILGQIDQDGKYLELVLTSLPSVLHDKKNPDFYLGYLSSLHQINLPLWEEISLNFLSTRDKEFVLPLLSTGITLKVEEFIFSHLENFQLSEEALSGLLFNIQMSYDFLGSEVVLKWIRKFSSTDSTILKISCLQSYAFLLRKSKDVWSNDLAKTFLTDTKLLTVDRSIVKRNTNLITNEWAQIAERFAIKNPNHVGIVLDVIFKLKSEKAGLIQFYGRAIESLVQKIFEKSPNYAWETLSKYLEDQNRSKLWYIEGLFKDPFHTEKDEQVYPLSFVDTSIIHSWIEKEKSDRIDRVVNLARLVPVDFSKTDSPSPLFIWILENYGDEMSIRQHYISALLTGGWVGKTSEHYGKILKKVQFLSNQFQNDNVQKWANEATQIIRKEIEVARLQEERRY